MKKSFNKKFKSTDKKWEKIFRKKIKRLSNNLLNIHINSNQSLPICFQQFLEIRQDPFLLIKVKKNQIHYFKHKMLLLHNSQTHKRMKDKIYFLISHKYQIILFNRLISKVLIIHSTCLQIKINRDKLCQK